MSLNTATSDKSCQSISFMRGTLFNQSVESIKKYSDLFGRQKTEFPSKNSPTTRCSFFDGLITARPPILPHEIRWEWAYKLRLIPVSVSVTKKILFISISPTPHTTATIDIPLQNACEVKSSSTFTLWLLVDLKSASICFDNKSNHKILTK